MIISQSLNLVIILISFLASKTVNPVKLSMILLILSMIFFFKMYFSGGSTWFPLLYFLIFMGGILMMFMILSSILPNEKSYKASKVIFLIPLTAIYLNSDFKMSQEVATIKSIKTCMDSSSLMSTMMIMMLLYFFLSIMMVSKEETPMRKSMC